MAKKKAAPKAPPKLDSVQWLEKTVPLAELKPYERNPRRISKDAYETLKRSLSEDGYHQRIVATHDLRIIGGHQRIRALKEIGLTDIPVLVPDRDLTDMQFRRILIRDNLPFGEFDFDMLAADFDKGELVDIGMPAEWLDEFNGEMVNGGLTDPDEAPPVPVTPVTQLGDMWILGTHTVRCGDSTSAAEVKALLKDVRPGLMVTDPPYGVNYDPSWREKAGVGSGGSAKGKVMNDHRADWREAWALFPGNVAYVWGGGLHSGNLSISLESAKFQIRAEIIWVKHRPAFSRGHYHWQHEVARYVVREGKDDNWRFEADHELAAYAVKEGQAADWKGGRKQSTVWFIENIKNETGHGTQKPVDCMKRPIVNNSSPGQAVYDPFLGSGTTVIAAEMMGRCCYGMELDPAYVDVIVKRWQDFTGLEAVNTRTRKTFNQHAELPG